MIIFLGLPKCGTMSLTESFMAAGYRAAHWKDEKGQYIGEQMFYALRNLKPILYYLQEYDVITQMDVCSVKENICLFPQVDLFELIYRQYPDAKYILNTRPISRHIRSIEAWGDFKQRLEHFGITDLHTFIQDHYDRVITFFKGKKNFLAFNIEYHSDIKLSEFVGRQIHLVHVNQSQQ